MSLNPIGCSPIARASNPIGKGCSQKLNRAAHLFNTGLKSLVDDIKPQMPGSNLIYVNAYRVIRDIIRDPISKGFNDTSNPCCEVGVAPMGILCRIWGSTCPNRSINVYFDGLHPTEAVNVLIARNAYSSNLTNEVYPINVKELAQL
ncbi:hypothetical protein U1Q18_037025 [Sarracenia purpurea var. burkii]